MKIFISYAHEDRSIAERIALALRANHHEVFIDRTGLEVGGEYNHELRKQIERCDSFVFLVSPDSIDGGFTLSEVGFREKRYPNPVGRVLPVLVRPVEDFGAIPPYLTAVTVLQPAGDIPAEVAAQFPSEPMARIATNVVLLGVPVLACYLVLLWLAAGLPWGPILAIVFVAVALWLRSRAWAWVREDRTTKVLAGVALGSLVLFGAYRAFNRTSVVRLVPAADLMAAWEADSTARVVIDAGGQTREVPAPADGSLIVGVGRRGWGAIVDHEADSSGFDSLLAARIPRDDPIRFQMDSAFAADLWPRYQFSRRALPLSPESLTVSSFHLDASGARKEGQTSTVRLSECTPFETGGLAARIYVTGSWSCFFPPGAWRGPDGR